MVNYAIVKSEPFPFPLEPTLYLHVWIAFGPQLLHSHGRTSIAEEERVLRQEIVAEKPPNGRVNLFARQVALKTFIRIIYSLTSNSFTEIVNPEVKMNINFNVGSQSVPQKKN